MLFQHVINVKIIEIFYILFHSESSKSSVVLLTVHNSGQTNHISSAQ